MIIEEKLQVNVWDNETHIVPYCVNCFERMLYVVYKEELPYFMLDPETLRKKLEEGYFKWHEDENGDYCCEEFMLDYVCDEIEYLENHIIMVMYDIDEEYGN